jgi:hypothetical protein
MVTIQPPLCRCEQHTSLLQGIPLTADGATWRAINGDTDGRKLRSQMALIFTDYKTFCPQISQIAP